MAYYNMQLTRKGDTDDGGWYHTTDTLTSGTYGNVYIFPNTPLVSVGATVTGSGSWEFSIDNPTKLGDGSASFSRWDGLSQMNLAVTGFRLVRDSGTVTGTIVAKTWFAS